MSKASGLKSEWLVENKENLALQRDGTFRVSFPTTVGTIKKAPQNDHYRHHFCFPALEILFHRKSISSMLTRMIGYITIKEGKGFLEKMWEIS